MKITAITFELNYEHVTMYVSDGYIIAKRWFGLFYDVTLNPLIGQNFGLIRVFKPIAIHYVK